MEIPGDKNVHFRHILYFAYSRGQKAAEAIQEICDVYGDDAINLKTAQDWYKKFKNGEFEVNGMSGSTRSSNLPKEDNRPKTRELAGKMNGEQKNGGDQVMGNYFYCF